VGITHTTDEERARQGHNVVEDTGIVIALDRHGLLELREELERPARGALRVLQTANAPGA
jgi:hypothetical protein